MNCENNSIEKFLYFQKESLIFEVSNRMSECLSATTRERLFRHSKEFGWKIFSLPRTNYNKVLIEEIINLMNYSKNYIFRYPKSVFCLDFLGFWAYN